MSLTAGDVCAIIKASGEAGVRRLSFEGLRLSFEKSSNDTRPPNPNPWELGPGPLAPSPTAPTPATPEHDAIVKDTLEDDEVKVREQQIEDLLLTDPLQAEELIYKGELGENDGREESDDEE